MARVSYSQYAMWSKCPQQYKLAYIDNLRSGEGNIYTIFGTAIHEAVQRYLEIMYEETKKKANKFDIHTYFKEVMIREFHKMHEANGSGKFLCTREELEEFYWDGIEILDWFRKDKNLRKFFSKRNYELIGIEEPLNFKVRPNISVIGFIDVILRNTKTGKYTIIDLKTSTRGWNKYQKTSDEKRNQILLYKKWYSEIYSVPTDMIDVEFHIMRRKLPDMEELEYIVPRISRFVPANGKPSLNRATKQFDHFLNEVFEDDGSYKDKEYVKNPGKHCEWCEFYQVQCNGKL